MHIRCVQQQNDSLLLSIIVLSLIMTTLHLKPMKGWAMQENSLQMFLRTHIYFGASDHHIRSWVLIWGGVNLSFISTLLWQLVLFGNYPGQINSKKPFFFTFKTKTVSISTPTQLVVKLKIYLLSESICFK